MRFTCVNTSVDASSQNMCLNMENQEHLYSQLTTQPHPTTPIRAGVPALRSWAPPTRGESASTGMLTICPQHILILPETHSPKEFLDADSPLHHPARNTCCLMASPALVLAAQTRHTSRTSDSCFVRPLRAQNHHMHKRYSLSGAHTTLFVIITMVATTPNL